MKSPTFSKTERPLRIWPSHILVLVYLALAAVSATAQSNYEPYYFGTLAGTAPGSADGAGNAARFLFPNGVAVDAFGNVYVADSTNHTHTIRKITPDGVVSTVAGQPRAEGSTDGIGSAARFSYPSGMAVDSSGNLYVADQGNHTIRLITPGGVVTTYAGKARESGSADGEALTARFYHPTGIAISPSGDVLVADTFNHTIRKITPQRMVTTVAGLPGATGSTDGDGSVARFYEPRGAAVDSDGNVYVADLANCTIRKISAGGVVTTVAGLARVAGSDDGAAGAARFRYPWNLAVTESGDIYVTDHENHTIRKVTAGGLVTTLAGLAAHREHRRHRLSSALLLSAWNCLQQYRRSVRCGGRKPYNSQNRRRRSDDSRWLRWRPSDRLRASRWTARGRFTSAMQATARSDESHQMESSPHWQDCLANRVVLTESAAPRGSEVQVLWPWILLETSTLLTLAITPFERSLPR